jgi:hypothetical protein
MEETNSNTQTTPVITEQNVLVTQAINFAAIPQQKVNSDLDQLKKAETSSEYKENIAKNIKNPLVYRAVSALRLVNPFKGY